MEDQPALPSLRLTVHPEALILFTTVLQSGIEIKADEGDSLGNFLSKLPGFTADYLADSVQTIFLNGTAVDNLTLPFTGKNPVLALSAAMPGLAGAIFRRNSFHSALRTETKSLQSASRPQKSITVTLKLFNSIARDRGVELLKRGVCMEAVPFAAFLAKRVHLLQQIEEILFNDKVVEATELAKALAEKKKINLNIFTKD